MNFDKVPTEDPQSAGTRSSSGNAVASYLLGLPTSRSRNIGLGTTALMRKEDYSFFVQDDWKLTPNLTINIGLRYDLIEWMKHRDDLLASIDIGTGEFLWDGVNPITGEGPNVRRGIVEPDNNNIAPRFGLAYRLGDKTTIRSGYGIFYMSNYLWEAQGVRGNWPFAISENQGNLNDRFPTNMVETTFSPELDVQFGSTVAPNAQHIVPRHNRTSYTQQWNLHVQRQLTEDLLVEVGYVGTRGLKMSTFSNVNTALPGPGDVQSRRPFPQYGPISEMGNHASSSYHGLQFKLDKRFSDGLSFRFNYAWGKTIDLLGAGFSASSTAQDPHNIGADRALSDLHRSQNFSFDYIWQLPFGKGKTYGSSMGGVADAILGGWQLTGITTGSTGPVFNARVGRDLANIGGRSGAQRPHLLRDPFAGVNQTAEAWFDTSRNIDRDGNGNPVSNFAWHEGAPFTFGSLGRNALIGPGLFQFDAGLFKNFKVTERIGVQFRSEFFNLFNNVNFGKPNANFDDVAAFGTIGGLTAGQFARQIQFGLKILF